MIVFVVVFALVAIAASRAIADAEGVTEDGAE